MSDSKTSATLRYTLMRIGIFAGCFFVLWGLVYLRVLPRGLGDSNLLWVLVLSILISAPLSLIVLRKQREAMAEQIAARVDRAKSRLEENRTREDVQQADAQ
ncbi:DUF4229 domain-containing protein [Streptomyces sp. NPDC091376]|uniref:DUF4229 domain-containing protein n=1 Tax=Streptomyces sp. NPDC091376 TaxID=3365994 RepID=UPI0037F86365